MARCSTILLIAWVVFLVFCLHVHLLLDFLANLQAAFIVWQIDWSPAALLARHPGNTARTPTTSAPRRSPAPAIRRAQTYFHFTEHILFFLGCPAEFGMVAAVCEKAAGSCNPNVEDDLLFHQAAYK
ncbi:MAG: hypothetical protein NZ777_10925 [Pseudomonadales bacterium]|nr:hypothetical protein [Pseudomonadales bacterium]